MTKAMRIRDAAGKFRVFTLYAEKAYTHTHDGVHIVLIISKNGKWRAACWQDVGEGPQCFGLLLDRYGRPIERANPRSVARAALDRWVPLPGPNTTTGS